MSPPDRPPNPAETLWARLADLTPARIGLGRTGASQPTREVLRFQLAHAAARDAIHVPLDLASLEAEVAALGCRSLSVRSDATERSVYLRRPDLGRRLAPESARALGDEAKGCDIVIVIGDGLSSRAVAANAVPLLAHLKAYAAHWGLSLAPVVLAQGARVALGDEIGQRLGARLCIMLIGERPGLSAPDSLGAYMTFGPRVGATDADRNCVSNIRSGGLDAVAAAYKIAWLVRQAFALQLSGTQLKDESDREADPEILRVGGPEKGARAE
ncbi:MULTISPECIES: ethanolamine ammonia-lyase subunit EutC [unclassified Bosea (in: a-proteobacteria)]|uniref:ethanolamine ammonia-lyase subunit EutC n=1 Tax=unclassified Bosea (in: a-proteobacteria) TaxID=2653178 RepID=UPI000957540A|nr:MULTISPECIES: ethanolamine ammonia-lyase subunit EutC [unclassified Bosea (in: a-proteobacteria)]TAJ27883.1 MAG: ethanolamine ammonia-lyase subunit EutC [Bosea sp. (in: a-proteobacteria)]SIQ70960.1 Ethanolamine ammonia-lyase light chain [Bosea sp. TND4EK4]